MRSDSAEYFRTIGGPGFDEIQARPALFPALPEYLPQIRCRRALRGHLDETAYAIRAHEVIGKRRRVLTVGELRATVGLRPDARVILLLFGKDELLERLWREGADLLPQLSRAGYAAVSAPSFSTYRPRPRMEILFNLKRSMVVLALLQGLGVPVIPRLGWEMPHDVDRAAEWLNENHATRIVALDWSTYTVDRDWVDQLDGLARLDELTAGRLRYLINGPSSERREIDIYRIVGPSRASITNARVMAAPPSREEAHLEAEWEGDPCGVRFKSRCHAERQMLARAAEFAGALPAMRTRETSGAAAASRRAA